MKLVYSREAVGDLERLRAFIAAKDPGAAARVARDLLQRIGNLRQFPLMGVPMATDFEPKVLRDMIFGAYIVRYAAQPETIIILRVWHHLEQRPDI